MIVPAPPNGWFLDPPDDLCSIQKPPLNRWCWYQLVSAPHFSTSSDTSNPPIHHRIIHPHHPHHSHHSHHSAHPPTRSSHPSSVWASRDRRDIRRRADTVGRGWGVPGHGWGVPSRMWEDAGGLKVLQVSTGISQTVRTAVFQDLNSS